MTFAPLQFAVPRVGQAIERHVLSNGIVLYLAEDRSLPVVDGYAVFRAGSLYEDHSRPGVAQLAASQLRNGGTATVPAESLNEELETLGASLEASASGEAISLRLGALAKDADRALQLLAEVIRRPAFDPKPLQISKGRAIEELRRVADSPAQLLAREFSRTLYTETHPLGRPLRPAHIEAIQPDDLWAHYRRYIRPNNMMLAVVGDFRREEMLEKIQRLFRDWPSLPLDIPPLPAVEPTYERSVYIIPRPLAQASLTLGHFGITRSNPDRFAIELMDAILGASGFSSRITEHVRVREGLAYSVGTWFPTTSPELGLFRAIAQTKNENVPRTVAAILEEMVRMQQQPVSPEELEGAKEAIINSFLFRFTSRFGTVVQLLMVEFAGYPSDYFDTLLDRYRAVTAEDIRRVAAQYLRPDAATILVIGDPTKFESAMGSFGPVRSLAVETPG
jgi:predicted Zn-dependent peptidase